MRIDPDRPSNPAASGLIGDDDREYYVPSTYRRPADRPHEGEALWEWCADRTGLGR